MIKCQAVPVQLYHSKEFGHDRVTVQFDSLGLSSRAVLCGEGIRIGSRMSPIAAVKREFVAPLATYWTNSSPLWLSFTRLKSSELNDWSQMSMK